MTTLVAPVAARCRVPALAIERACAGIAPAWPLDRAIAVNPLHGRIARPFERVAADLEATTGARFLPPRALSRELWRQGRFGREHLAEALREEGRIGGATRIEESVDELVAALADESPEVPRLPLLSDFADDRRSAPLRPWSLEVVEQLAAFLAVWFDTGAAGRGVDRSGGLYGAWRLALAADQSLPGRLGGMLLRERLALLPAEPGAAIEHAAERLGLDAALLLRVDYLGALLATVRGFASVAAFHRFQARLRGADDSSLVELLAVRMAWEVLLLDTLGLHEVLPRFHRKLAAHGDRLLATFDAQREDRLYLRASELACQSDLLRRLAAPGPTGSAAPVATEVAAVFCIDVRSERLRRALEATSGGAVATHGFAGFFGLPIATKTLGAAAPRPRLPGLLAPTLQAGEAGFDPTHTEQVAERRRERLSWWRAWSAFRSGPGSAFAYVETCGLWSLGSLLGELLVPRPSVRAEHAGLPRAERQLLQPSWGGAEAPSLAQRTELAARALRGMGLTRDLPPLVVFVGHGSSSRNNAHAATLDCGACGGHSGEANARLLAITLADPQVRRGLVGHGIVVPATTRFLAALHDTTTDEVQVFDGDGHGDSRCARLRAWFARAGEAVRRERAPALGLGALVQRPSALLAALQRRAGDWGQVRPEWGLSDNAALVFAPRDRTCGIDLDGRVFLHDYNVADDADGSLLTQLLSAPMQVASWINLQYYASVVDPRTFGAGNKRLHDVVGGGIGVCEGRGGDLRIGLPLQSVHDGRRFRHTPLRLSVFVAADEARIDAALAASEPARQLVENGWLHLFRLAEDGRCWLRRRAGGWVAASPVEAARVEPVRVEPVRVEANRTERPAQAAAHPRLRGMLATMLVLAAAVGWRSWFGG
ncbi:MAG: DUF2309 domain-containing protein [Planctomycetota bacterium]